LLSQNQLVPRYVAGEDASDGKKTFIAATTYRQEVCETHKRPGEVGGLYKLKNPVDA
jgi:hypothetical protein